MEPAEEIRTAYHDAAEALVAVVDDAALVRALTGRAPLPGEFNVLG
jgi:hypothetical protein